MAATGWLYYVPYQADINNALQELREKVFQSENYRGTAYYFRQEYSFYMLPPEVVEDFTTELARLEALPKPQSIEEAIQRRDGDGTHSILDISTVSSEPEFYAAAPLQEQELLELFGTDKPTRADVEEKLLEVSYLRARNEASYIIIYKNGEPDEIAFKGSTGD